MTEVDVIDMTQIQNEYGSDPTRKAETLPNFHVKQEHMSMMQTYCAILHPLPRRYGIDVRSDKDPRAAYWRQERCGMWVRAALICYIFGVDGEIMSELS